MPLLIIVHMKYSVHVLWYQYCLLDISTTSNLVYVFTHNSLVQLIQLNAISFVYDGEQSFLAVVSERMKRAPDLSLKKNGC